jgi:hypothetical protein
MYRRMYRTSDENITELPVPFSIQLYLNSGNRVLPIMLYR